MHTFLTVVIVAKLAAAWPAIQPSEHETHYKRVPPMSFACDELPGTFYSPGSLSCRANKD